MTERLMALVAFGGECEDLDVDAAAKELRAARYKVFRLPDEHAAPGRAGLHAF